MCRYVARLWGRKSFTQVLYAVVREIRCTETFFIVSNQMLKQKDRKQVDKHKDWLKVACNLHCKALPLERLT